LLNHLVYCYGYSDVTHFLDYRSLPILVAHVWLRLFPVPDFVWFRLLLTPATGARRFALPRCYTQPATLCYACLRAARCGVCRTRYLHAHTRTLFAFTFYRTRMSRVTQRALPFRHLCHTHAHLRTHTTRLPLLPHAHRAFPLPPVVASAPPLAYAREGRVPDGAPASSPPADLLYLLP